MEYSQSLIRLMKQPSREVKVRIEILNLFDNVVDCIEGLCTEKSLSIDNTNLIRRSIDLTFVANNKIEINKNSPLWVNKRIRLFTGIKNMKDEIIWFNRGIYVISNPEKNLSASGKFISIKGYDKMKLFDQPFMFNTTITSGTPIHEAIKNLATLVGETKLIIETTNYTIPETIQPSADDTIEKTLKEIVELYMNYQVYFNVDGYFVFEKMKNRINDPVIWEFTDDKMVISKNTNYDYDNVKNYIKVLGKYNEKTSVQPKYEIKITNNNNEFSIDNLGEERKMCIVENNYNTEEQCKLRCEYELEKVENLAKTSDIECVPILLIDDVNRVIQIQDEGIIRTCLIDKISSTLTSMSISCHEIFK